MIEICKNKRYTTKGDNLEHLPVIFRILQVANFSSFLKQYKIWFMLRWIRREIW